MITGYNTELRRAGTVFHVQTEDKTQSNGQAVIESLVFVGGHILGAHRTPYDANALAEDDVRARMDAQHRAVMARIQRGELDHKLSGRGDSQAREGGVDAAQAGLGKDGDAHAALCEDGLDRALLSCLTLEARREHLILELSPDGVVAGETTTIELRAVSSRGRSAVAGATVIARLAGDASTPIVVARATSDPEGRAALVLDLPSDAPRPLDLVISADSTIGKATARWRT